MKTSIRRTLTALIALTTMTGCWAAAGGMTGAGTVAYLEGQSVTNEKASLEQVWEASLAGVSEIGYTITQQDKDGLRGHIAAHGSDDRPLEVTLDRVSDTETRLSIRFGVFGDQEDSKLLHQKIAAQLR